MGRGRNSVNKATQSPAEGHSFCGEHDAGVANYRESRAPTVDSIHAIDYSRRLEFFETACKVFAVPKEMRHVWSRMRFFHGFERR